MFKTHAGPVESDAAVAYLRPETAQGCSSTSRTCSTRRASVHPSGSPKSASRSATRSPRATSSSAPGSSSRWSSSTSWRPTTPRWFDYWCDQRYQWYLDLGIPADRLRLRPHDADELSHYSSATSDVEFLYPWGWGELEGVANRGDYDLTQHAEASGQALEYFDQATGQRYVPHVIEPAAGATRAMMAFLLAAYDTDEVNGEARTVLRLHHRLAPYQVAVLPLSRKDADAAGPRGAGAGAATMDVRLRRDPGHRPALPPPGRDRHPWCVTVDFDSLDDGRSPSATATASTRSRVPIAKLVDELADRLASVSRRLRRPAGGPASVRARSRTLWSRGVTFVYAFDHPHVHSPMSLKDLLGGKGANLAEMTSVLELPVPPGFTISTEACRSYMATGWPEGLSGEIEEHLVGLEKAMDKRLGDAGDPLLVSVRSGAKFSMPGMMDTVLNLGLNDQSVEGLAKQTGDDRFAYDSYRRFIQMFGKIVLDVPGDDFEHLFEEAKERSGTTNDADLGADALAEVVRGFKELVEQRTGAALPPGSRGPAAPGHRGRLRLVELTPGQRLPEPGEALPRPRHRRQRAGDGVRQQGRRLRHGRRLHPRPEHRRPGCLRRLPGQRPG